jgi:hypothetical protein
VARRSLSFDHIAALTGLYQDILKTLASYHGQQLGVFF